MFDLEKALANWRQRMRLAGLKDPTALDELETHLRDDIEAQLRSGLAVGEAFESAMDRIVSVDELSYEYTKVGREPGDLILLGCAVLYFIFAGGSVLFKLGSFSDVTSAQQIFGFAAVVITVTLLLTGRVFARTLPVIPDRRLRMAIYGIGMVAVSSWLIFFYYGVIMRSEWGMSQLVVALVWAWIPMGALCSLIFGVERAAADTRKKADV
ncbi:MAG TPA: hypothetical protein VJ063_01210 [Verrucomicrobiae bacterium]|nr:hypothetical protein [Verrucomicrobiae bacterium]